MAFLGIFPFDMCQKRITKFVDVTSFDDAMMSYVMLPCHTCVGHVTIYYKRPQMPWLGELGSAQSPETLEWPRVQRFQSVTYIISKLWIIFGITLHFWYDFPKFKRVSLLTRATAYWDKPSVSQTVTCGNFNLESLLYMTVS